MVLDFAKVVLSNEERESKLAKVKKINSAIKVDSWTDEMLDAFLLGYALGMVEK